MNPVNFKLETEFAHEAPLMSCAFDAGGRFVFAGGRDRSILAVRLDTAKKSLLRGHESWVGAMVRAGDVVLTADFAGRVIAWDSSGQEPRPRWTIAAHPSTIYGLSASVDGKTFATGDRDGLVRIWQTDDGKLLHELPRNEFPVYGVALHPDGRRIVIADRQPKKPRVQVWEAAAGKQLLSIDVAELSGYRSVEDIEWGGIRALALSPDGTQIVACGRNGYDGQACVMVYETNSGKLQRKWAESLKGGFYYSAKFDSQALLMTAGGDIAKGEFRCWKLNENKSVVGIATSGPCLGLDVHPDGHRVAAAQAIGKKSAPESGLLSVYRPAT